VTENIERLPTQRVTKEGKQGTENISLSVAIKIIWCG